MYSILHVEEGTKNQTKLCIQCKYLGRTYISTQTQSYGVNRSNLSKLFVLQNFKNIDGMTLILTFWFPRVSAGPQKSQTFSFLICILIFRVAADLSWKKSDSGNLDFLPEKKHGFIVPTQFFSEKRMGLQNLKSLYSFETDQLWAKNTALKLHGSQKFQLKSRSFHQYS